MSKKAVYGKESRTHRLEIGNTFSGWSSSLRFEQTFLLEDKARSNEESTDDCQNNTNDLAKQFTPLATRGGGGKWLSMTFKLEPPAEKDPDASDDVAAAADWEAEVEEDMNGAGC